MFPCNPSIVLEKAELQKKVKSAPRPATPEQSDVLDTYDLNGKIPFGTRDLVSLKDLDDRSLCRVEGAV